MPKNIEDIIVPDRKSIRDIPIPSGRKKINLVDAFTPKNSPPPESAPSSPLPPPPPPPPPPPRSRFITRDGLGDGSNRKYSKKSIWIGAGVAVVVLFITIFSLMVGATLNYTPKTAIINFNKDVYTAHKDAENQLLFSVIKLSGDKGVEVPASGEERVSRKAQGTIIVYNNSGTNSQRLIKTTRFETPDGKIYRVESDIIVPGQKRVGGDLVPGSLEITVVADEPGESYNIPPTDFTLPGLKGDSKYTTIYARSKGAMTGGFVGIEKKVSSADLSKAKTTLEASLKEELLTQARAQLPEDFILFPNLTSIIYEDLPQSNQAGSQATVNERGNFYGVMFKKKDLVNYLAQKKLVASADTPVDISDLSSLELSFVGQPLGDLLKAEQISFQIDGSTTVVFITDEEALRSDLAGTKKSDQDAVLSEYPSIMSARAILRPFWKNSFPTDASKIKIVKNIQK